jgi:purine-cytosine permease-like protein
VAGIYSFQGLVNYLTLITALLIPTTGVLVVDYFIRNRRQMLAEELFKGRTPLIGSTRVGTFAP